MWWQLYVDTHTHTHTHTHTMGVSCTNPMKIPRVIFLFKSACPWKRPQEAKLETWLRCVAAWGVWREQRPDGGVVDVHGGRDLKKYGLELAFKDAALKLSFWALYTVNMHLWPERKPESFLRESTIVCEKLSDFPTLQTLCFIETALPSVVGSVDTTGNTGPRTWRVP